MSDQNKKADIKAAINNAIESGKLSEEGKQAAQAILSRLDDPNASPEFKAWLAKAKEMYASGKFGTPEEIKAEVMKAYTNLKAQGRI